MRTHNKGAVLDRGSTDSPITSSPTCPERFGPARSCVLCRQRRPTIADRSSTRHSLTSRFCEFRVLLSKTLVLLCTVFPLTEGGEDPDKGAPDRRMVWR